MYDELGPPKKRPASYLVNQCKYMKINENEPLLFVTVLAIAMPKFNV